MNDNKTTKNLIKKPSKNHENMLSPTIYCTTACFPAKTVKMPQYCNLVKKFRP